jgi:hypothetical protein
VAWTALTLILGTIGYYVIPFDRSSNQEERGTTENDPSRHERTKQLHTLLDRFRLAYEQRDLSSLQALSHMGEARQRNLRLMFANYATFTVSLKMLSETEAGAAAVLTLDSAAKPDGEPVELPPLAKTIRVTIPWEGSDWGKIVW